MSGRDDPVSLEDLGWDEAWAAAFATQAARGYVPARVVVEHRGAYRLLSAGAEWRGEVAGRLRHAIESGAERPAVGDWVAVRTTGSGVVTIQDVLPRRTAVRRKVAGKRSDIQVLAANIDTLFVAIALQGDFRPRRLERYLAVVWESGALPVVLLTKADRCTDVPARVAAAEAAAPGVAVHVTSARTGLGLDALRAYLSRARTAALLGPSGTGKSTLVNALLGEERLAIGAVRATDGRGRHTTTERQWIHLPGGGSIIDTPGLRELALGDDAGGADQVFTDIAALAAGCRFADCRHVSEPDCAVRAAIEAGRLDPGRLDSQRKLEREAQHLAAKRDAGVRAEQNRKLRRMFREFARAPKRGREDKRRDS